VFHPSGDDEELALAKVCTADDSGGIFPVQSEASGQDEEQLIFVLVPVPHELALKLHQPDVLTVQLSDDTRSPVLMDEGEFFSEVDFLQHGCYLRFHAMVRRTSVI
jgi:hypothetical protein